jgi:hypothetical protein
MGNNLRKGRTKLKLLLLFLFIFSSCTDKPPIPEKKFAELYVRLKILDAQYAIQPSIQKVKADSVLHAFNLNDSLVGAELLWYNKKPERWQRFFEETQRRLNEIKGDFLKSKH